MNTFAKALLAVMIFTGVSSAALASGSSNGKLTQLASLTSGVVIFNAGSHTGGPTCAGSPGQDWAIDTSTPQGKAAYAILLTAITTDKAVTVNGTGDRNIWSDRESAQLVFLNF